MRKAAKYPKAVFDSLLEEFVQTAEKKSLMVAMMTNLKGVERGTAKAQAKFGGDVTQISDVVRATVVVKGDVKDLYDAVAMSRKHLERSGGVCVKFHFLQPGRFRQRTPEFWGLPECILSPGPRAP